MPLKRITAPTKLAVEVAEVKDFLRLQGTTAEDMLLQSFIKTAQDYAENYCKRSIMRQQWELRIDDFNGTDGDIELPRPPLTTVSTEVVISYVKDTTVGDTTTMPTTAYTVDFYSEPALIYPSYDNEWPTPRDEKNAVRITYYSGYTTVSLPEPIKQWVMLRVGTMYEHRESVSHEGQFNRMPFSFVDGLLDPYVIQMVVT